MFCDANISHNGLLLHIIMLFMGVFLWPFSYGKSWQLKTILGFFDRLFEDNNARISHAGGSPSRSECAG
jgi:hypothetical protein